MHPKQSSNQIPIIHRLITNEHGENHWLNGCLRYVMECAGEKDYDYDFFAGLTGDNLVQPYALNGGFFGDDVSSFLLCNSDPHRFFDGIFGACGYTADFVPEEALQKNPALYAEAVISQIDKGLPVIFYGYGGPPYGVFVGYEESGNVLLYITGNSAEPVRIPLDTATGAAITDKAANFGWIFLGKKEEQRDLKQIYRDAILKLPELLMVKTEKYCFGAGAFRTWADELDGGKFDSMKAEEFEPWSMYTTYVCCLATNSGGCQRFLEKARELNPDFNFLKDVRKQYMYTAYLWNGGYWNDVFSEEDRDSVAELLGNDNLEALGGGFNITFEALQSPERRGRITAIIRRLADSMDEVLRILKDNLHA